jgi:hypothetical protein
MTEFSELPHAEMRLGVLMCSAEDTDGSSIGQNWIEKPAFSATRPVSRQTLNSLKWVVTEASYRVPVDRMMTNSDPIRQT